MTTPDPVSAWARHHGTRLRQHLLDRRFTPSDTPETDAVQYVIDALCDGACPWAAAIREYVDRRVAGMKEAA